MQSLQIVRTQFLTQCLIRCFTKCRTAWRVTWLFIFTLITFIIIPIIFNPLASKLPKKREIASFFYRRMYRALNINLVVTGEPTQQPSLWVCNHISWLDILLLAGGHTVDFIAKSEVGEWPFVGGIVKKSGTVLIDRDNIFQAYRSLPILQERMLSGTPVMVFPEGTTTNGTYTLPFKPMFYQAAIRENLLIQPISLHYLDAQNELTDSVAFIDDDDFGVSLKRILKEPKITAHLHFLPAMKAKDFHRKMLAEQNQSDINNNISAHLS